MSTSPSSDEKIDERQYWIQRIDQARAVITLIGHVLLSDHGPDDADTACALDLTNQELQRLRDEIDLNISRGVGESQP